MKKDRVVHIMLPISKIVYVTCNDGGYLSMECSYCGAGGYVRDSDYGYRHGSKGGEGHLTIMGNEIIHEISCVLNQYIERDTGKLIERKSYG